MSFNSTVPETNKKLENILIIGSGGRENSLGWVIQKNELIKKIYLVWEFKLFNLDFYLF